jgi:hypothetical protein
MSRPKIEPRIHTEYVSETLSPDNCSVKQFLFDIEGLNEMINEVKHYQGSEYTCSAVMQKRRFSLDFLPEECYLFLTWATSAAGRNLAVGSYFFNLITC